MDPKINIRLLVQWLGADGARAGMRASKNLTLNELRKIAAYSGVKYNPAMTRNEVIDLLILQYDRRITKSFEEMKIMKSSELADYLDKTGCSKLEIIELLEHHKIKYRKADSLPALIRHAADHISSMGAFQRLSGLAEKTN